MEYFDISNIKMKGENMDSKWIIEEVARTIRVEAETIAVLPQTVDMGTVSQIVRLLGDTKGKIILSGCGTSAMACKKICHSLCCIERPAAYLTPSDAIHGGLGLLQAEDILVMISKGGGTSELVPLATACKIKGAKLIAVTENPTSILGKMADICLRIKVEAEPDLFNMLATASTLAVIAVFDAICIALMEYTNYTKEQFAVIHPAGAVGERLLSGR